MSKQRLINTIEQARTLLARRDDDVLTDEEIDVVRRLERDAGQVRHESYLGTLNPRSKRIFEEEG
jgi:hypothetical protein